MPTPSPQPATPAIGTFLNASFPCPVCTQTERRVVSNRGRNQQVLTTVICTSCGLVHSHPMPTREELDAFYTSSYRLSYKSSFKPKLKHALRYAPQARKRVQEILSHTTQQHKRLLDIGSGSGEFLFMARHEGLSAVGIEPNQGYATYTQEDLALPVTHTTLEKSGYGPESFDIVNLNHVLEHMPEPLDTLTRINTLLPLGGLLAISVPDIASLRHSPTTRFHYAHVYNFNTETLRALLTIAGFEVVAATGTTTTFIAVKRSLPLQKAGITIPGNYEKLWAMLSSQNRGGHYLTLTPYSRLVRKAFQYARERLQLRNFTTAEQILSYHATGIKPHSAQSHRRHNTPTTTPANTPA